MSNLQIGFLILICVFGSSLLGIYAATRLPDHHLEASSREIIKASRAVVVGLAALTLGLLIAAAKTSFDTKFSQMKEGAARMISLDLLLVKYGDEARPARAALRQMVQGGVNRIELINRQGKNADASGRGESIGELLSRLLALNPSNDSQSWLKNAALTLYGEIAVTRWTIFEESASSIPQSLLVILTFWLMVIFFSLGLISPRNASALSALLLAAASMSGAVVVTLELDQPYAGLISVSAEPLHMALQQLSLNR